jgi:hypothetical protein
MTTMTLRRRSEKSFTAETPSTQRNAEKTRKEKNRKRNQPWFSLRFLRVLRVSAVRLFLTGSANDDDSMKALSGR